MKASLHGGIIACGRGAMRDRHYGLLGGRRGAVILYTIYYTHIYLYIKRSIRKRLTEICIHACKNK